MKIEIDGDHLPFVKMAIAAADLQQPKPMAETCMPVRPNGRYSIAYSPFESLWQVAGGKLQVPKCQMSRAIVYEPFTIRYSQFAISESSEKNRVFLKNSRVPQG